MLYLSLHYDPVYAVLLSPFASTVSRDLVLQDPLDTIDHGEVVDPRYEPSAGSLLDSVERLLAPIQTPATAGVPIHEPATGGLSSTLNSANPTFGVLKATAMQQAFGHPMAYARVLMQVCTTMNQALEVTMAL